MLINHVWDWRDTPLRAVLAFTVAVIGLAVLRRPWRALFGGGAPYVLWLVVPLVFALTLAPANAPPGFSSVAMQLREVAVPLAAPANASEATAGWDRYLLLAWLAGIAGCALWFGMAQWRYSTALRNAYPLGNHEGIPVFVAARPDIGPALLGLFTPQIILPSDFAERFTAGEQALILAHEQVHAGRRDTAWSALAHVVVILFWFHPLAWWALGAFRTDQELACDATVVREHAHARRTYAEALLKNHGVTRLPVGCTWLSTHPLTERIAMLTSTPTKLRRRIAAIAAPFALLGVMASAWSTTPAPVHAKPQYQLQADIAATSGSDAHVTVCAYENEAASITPATKDGTPSWTVTFTVTPAPQAGMLDITIDSARDDAHHRVASRQILRGKPGEAMAVRYSENADSGLRAIDIVPSTGCPAAGKAHA